jgi:hypothetical protein
VFLFMFSSHKCVLDRYICIHNKSLHHKQEEREREIKKQQLEIYR